MSLSPVTAPRGSPQSAQNLCHSHTLFCLWMSAPGLRSTHTPQIPEIIMAGSQIRHHTLDPFYYEPGGFLMCSH